MSFKPKDLLNQTPCYSFEINEKDVFFNNKIEETETYIALVTKEENSFEFSYREGSKMKSTKVFTVKEAETLFKGRDNKITEFPKSMIHIFKSEPNKKVIKDLEVKPTESNNI